MKRTGLVIAAALTTLGCAGETTHVIQGAPCTTEDMGTCVEISCPGSDPVEVCDGADGQDGDSGPAGQDGLDGEQGPQGDLDRRGCRDSMGQMVIREQ